MNSCTCPMLGELTKMISGDEPKQQTIWREFFFFFSYGGFDVDVHEVKHIWGGKKKELQKIKIN